MVEKSPSAYRHVRDLWDGAAVEGLDPVERLVYRSNRLGDDQRITNTGGGNTSSKIMETDPLTGEPVDILWVKGSGGDLRTSRRENFASLYQSKLGAPISPADVARAIHFLLGQGAARTTGQILAVDGGLQEAFLR